MRKQPHLSASGLLSMLSEDDAILRGAALSRLLKVIDTLWHEVAEFLPDLEAMAEDEALSESQRQCAAAVASHVFFHLEEPNQALRLALEGGPEHFDIKKSGDATEKDSTYTQCLMTAAVDAYIKINQHSTEPQEETTAAALDGDLSGIDVAKLNQLVELMFERCYKDNQLTHALGIAIEAQKIEKIREVLDHTPQTTSCSVIQYGLDAALKLISSRSFRNQVVQVICEKLQSWPDSFVENASIITMCHVLLDAPEKVAETLSRLLDSNKEEEYLSGYQICFDLVDSGNQKFAHRVSSHLPQKESSSSGEEKDATSTPRSDETWSKYDKAQQVLIGGFASQLALSFLHKQSDSDVRIMENLKKAMEDRGGGSKNSVLHNCAVMTHSYLNAGTTNDSFLRDHLEWMKKANNWAKFSATASLGVLHVGHTVEAMNLLEPYLPPSSEDGAEPQPVSSSGGYAEGGSLYALGLIHCPSTAAAKEKKNTCEYLRRHLRASHANEVISHGAALGVGLTALGTADLEIVQELKELIETDSAVAGEAGGIAIGLVLAGSGVGNLESAGTSRVPNFDELSLIMSELKDYARDTKHEKIIRGIALGIAITNFGQEENADAVIEEMRGDRDPILRYGAQYAIALAYCGTGSNKAIRILLHTAVSDVSDDVRMAAVIGLAFVLFKTPERVPQLVNLLLESFNPHVRYASCMAVGLAMAGTGDSDAVALLEPMLNDMTDFVRQGALMGTAMLYMQQSDTCNGKKIKTFREKLVSITTDKHQSMLTKMGANLATGIIDAGGRNASLNLASRSGFTKMTSAVGLVLWLQHWHWYPMMHMFGVALTPTFTIGLNKDFKYPKNYEMQCNAKPSVFAYPKRLEEKKEKEKKRVVTVTLSTTAKNKARLARKRALESESGEGADANMEIDEKKSDETNKVEDKADAEAEEGLENMETEGDNNNEATATGDEEKAKPEKKKKREPEPGSFRVKNPCRVTKSQSEFCEFDFNQRYRPVRPAGKKMGVVVLIDSTPGEEEDVAAVKSPSLDYEDEADPPEPFEWAPPGHAEYVASAVPIDASKES